MILWGGDIIVDNSMKAFCPCEGNTERPKVLGEIDEVERGKGFMSSLVFSQKEFLPYGCVTNETLEELLIILKGYHLGKWVG